MSFTAAEAIEEAREQHPSFDPGRSPDKVCLRQLNRYTREVYARVVEKDDQLYVSEHVEALPLADFDVGFDLPADYMKMLGGHVLDDCELRHVMAFVPFRSRWAPGTHTPAYILGRTVHLCGYEGDWLRAVSVVLKYVPEPVLPAAGTDDVPLPDAARRVVVDNLAFWMARRQGPYEQGTGVSVNGFYKAWRESEGEFLVELAQHTRAESSYIREEW